MINQAKLKNVVRKNGKIEAQCPACAAAGADSKGNHLVVYADGKFACVANPGDKKHSKEIFKLVGERGAVASPQLKIQRQTFEQSKVIMHIGRIGHEISTPVALCENSDTAQVARGVE